MLAGKRTADSRSAHRLAARWFAPAPDGPSPSHHAAWLLSGMQGACGRLWLAQTSFSSKALSTARVRSRTPSLERMFETWFLTVPSATPSELAISLFE